MRNLSTYLLLMFMIMFWVFRIFVTVMAEMSMDFGGIVPLNTNMEIILLFVVLVCMIFIVKRKVIGALVYLLSYGMYFGVDLYNNVMKMMETESTLAISTSINLFISIIAMIIPIAVLIDMLADKNRKLHPKDKKTDWFYANDKFDRKMDDRADKNNYKTL